MNKFKAYFNYSLISVICLGILMAGMSCKQTGKTGSAGDQAGEPAVLEKQPGYIVIIGGGKTAGDAENSMYRFNKRTFPFELSVSFPKIFLSDSIEGLNPGFQICVLGFCKEQATAEKIRNLVNVTSEEVAYIKKVNHYMAYVDCPKIPFSQSEYPEYTQVFSGPVRDNVPSVLWSLYSQTKYYEEIDCEVVSYILVVLQGNHEIDTEGFDEICFKPEIIEEENFEEYEEGQEEGNMEGYGIEEEDP
ncbi:MAG: hypothetical protein ISS19_18040, partial [Bacteroidales bacterium]|nr:hypothetical protein [Bacteroidales bacterium]